MKYNEHEQIQLKAIKPCAHCRGNDISIGRDHTIIVHLTDITEDVSVRQKYRITCNDCNYFMEGNQLSSLVKLWNSRA